MIMIMKKTGFLVAAAAAAVLLSGCATGARNMPENTPVCEAPCMPQPCNPCKTMNCCRKMMNTSDKMMCPSKCKKRHHHRRCTADNAQTQTQTPANA